MFRESHTRSVAKALSWRVLGTVATTLLVFLFTRQVVLSLTVGAVEFLAKIGLFWLHERLWDKLPFGRQRLETSVVWLTGLPSAGKSTLADAVADALRARGEEVERLDGDAVRRVFPELGYSRADRDTQARRVGFIAARLADHGVWAVVSLISPYRESREAARAMARNFVEIYVSTPLEECERRDPKGLYRQARRGELGAFTGISDPYEAPVSPDLAVDLSTKSVRHATEQVLDLLRRRGRKAAA